MMHLRVHENKVNQIVRKGERQIVALRMLWTLTLTLLYLVVALHLTMLLVMQGEEADTQGATDGADGFDDCDDDLVDPSPSVTDHRYDAISRYSWYQPVIHSIAFMRATLLAAKKEYKMRTTTVADWVNVAREMLYEWSEDEYPKHNDKVHLSFDYGDFDAVLAAVPLLPKEKKEKKMSAQLQK